MKNDTKAKHEKDKEKKGKNKKIRKKLFRIIFILFIIAIIASLFYLAYYMYAMGKAKKEIKDIQEYMSITDKVTDEQIEKLKEMQSENENIKAWIEIADSKINYPVLQAEDNEYYLNHNYKNEKSKYGSIFLKDKSILNNSASNLIMYGHHMKDGEMFQGITKYTNKDYYENHKTVTLVTNQEVREYEIFAAFKSRIFYKKEKNVFRFYDGINFANEEEYNTYVENVKNIQLYDTGVTAHYGEQLLTMITCEYSQSNGRMVVVAKRVK